MRSGFVRSVAFVALVLLAAFAVWRLIRTDVAEPDDGLVAVARPKIGEPSVSRRSPRPAVVVKPRRRDSASGADVAGAAAFAAETDKWLLKRPVTADDVRSFSRMLGDVSPAQRKGALRRALNLIPDDNVELLAGVLFDRSQPEEVVREVFHDIINRPDGVKGPILRRVARDKTHPCNGDAVWIFKVTGERME